jgi:hypothetical protein
MHLETSLPSAIENGARRIIHRDLEVVTTDGGNEVRNTRWSSPLRSWEISFNNAAVDNVNHLLVEQLWEDTESGTHTFNWHDERRDETVRVRFDSDLTITNTVGPYHRIDTFIIKEVRNEGGPGLNTSPAITGTMEVGETLTISFGSWTGSPTFARQWLRNGVSIPGATLTTYLLDVADEGAIISCRVTATNVDGVSQIVVDAPGVVAP